MLGEVRVKVVSAKDILFYGEYSDKIIFKYIRLVSCQNSLLVRQLRTEFVSNVDALDKSTKFFLHATHCHSIQFLIGTTSSKHIMAAILDYQDGRHVKTYIPISQLLSQLGSKSSSKHAFSVSRNHLLMIHYDRIYIAFSRWPP